MNKIIFAFLLVVMPYTVFAFAEDSEVEVNICDTCELKKIEDLYDYVQNDIDSVKYFAHHNYINYIIHVDFDQLYYNDKIFDYIYLDEYNTLNSWSSNDESVAKVENNMIIPVGVGETTVVSDITGVQRPMPPECVSGGYCIWPSYYFTYTFVIKLVDEKPELNISINSEDDVAVDVGDKLDFDISLKHQSYKASTDNVISIKIPSWIEVDKSSISNGGQVLGESVVWNVDDLPQDKQLSFHFSATVLNSGKDLKTLKYELRSVLTSNLYVDGVESNKVILNISADSSSSEKNPNTNVGNMLLVILFTISGVIYFWSSTRTKKI